jgi:hypothetical protein
MNSSTSGSTSRPVSTADLDTEQTTSPQVFESIRAFSLSSISRACRRDRQIADRITALHRDAIAEDERIVPDSLAQFTSFFLEHGELGLPKITLTPNGLLRARWIHGPGDFVAIEFTGKPLVKLIAELPRGNDLTAQHFSSEHIDKILSIAQSIGLSLA